MQTLQQNQTSEPLPFFIAQSSDHITGLTGATPTVTISKNGGSFATPAGAVSEIGNGWYAVAGNATDSNTLGPLLLHATAASGDPCKAEFHVEPSNDSAFTPLLLGLESVPSPFYSPYNWYNSGSYYQSNNPGAYVRFSVVCASDNSTVTVNLDTSNLSGVTSSLCPALRFRIDGGSLSNQSQLSPSSSTQAINITTTLSAGTHTIEVWFDGVDYTIPDRWVTPQGAVRITSFGGSSGVTFPATTWARPGRMLVYGDSIVEGFRNTANSGATASQDAAQCFSTFNMEGTLNCELGVVGYADQGFDRVGNGGIPAFSSTWNLYSSGLSRLTDGLLSPPPDLIVIEHGFQPCTSPTIQTTLAAIRAAAPNALIAKIQTFPYGDGIGSDNDATAVSAFATYMAAHPDDTRLALLTGFFIYGGQSFDGVHPTVAGGQLYGTAAALAIRQATLTSMPLAVASAVWSALTSALTTAGSMGKFLLDRIGAIIPESGPVTIAFTVQRSDNNAVIQGVSIRLSSAGVTAWAGISGSDGTAAAQVNDGAYTLSATLAGYQLASPTSITVSADGAQTITMTPIVITPATDPSRITVYGTTFNGDGSIAPNQKIIFTLSQLPAGSVGFFETEQLTTTSDASTAVFQIELIKGAIYCVQWGVKKFNFKTPTTGTSFAMPGALLDVAGPYQG